MAWYCNMIQSILYRATYVLYDVMRILIIWNNSTCSPGGDCLVAVQSFNYRCSLRMWWWQSWNLSCELNVVHFSSYHYSSTRHLVSFLDRPLVTTGCLKIGRKNSSPVPWKLSKKLRSILNYCFVYLIQFCFFSFFFFCMLIVNDHPSPSLFPCS